MNSLFKETGVHGGWDKLNMLETLKQRSQGRDVLEFSLQLHVMVLNLVRPTSRPTFKDTQQRKCL